MKIMLMDYKLSLPGIIGGIDATGSKRNDGLVLCTDCDRGYMSLNMW